MRSANRATLGRLWIWGITIFFHVACKSDISTTTLEPSSGTLTLNIAGSPVSYRVIPDSCSNIFGLSCSFSASGAATDFPQFKFFFSRTLSAGLNFTTDGPLVFFGNSFTNYENSCQKSGGGAYNSYYNGNGTVQINIAEYSTDFSGSNIKFTFNGDLYRSAPAYSKTLSAGSVNLHICTDISQCPSNSTTTNADATSLNRNQLYSNIAIGPKESKCYRFTAASAQTYSLQITSAVSVNSLSVSYAFNSGNTYTSGGCTTSGNGTCNIPVTFSGVQPTVEIIPGNNLGGSFSMQLTP